jgi:aminopeptidase N
VVLPIRFGLVGPNGSPMGWSGVTGGTVRDDLIEMDTERLVLTFAGIPNRPVPSLFRGFSAPVNIRSSLGFADRLFLARHDEDPFNRWQALQDVATDMLVGAARGQPWTAGNALAFAEALDETIASKVLDNAFKANAMALPNELAVARALQQNVDPDRVRAVRLDLIREVVARIAPSLEKLYLTNDSRLAYSPDFRQAGRRSMKNAALALLVLGGAEHGARLAREQYERALNMTDRLAALGMVVGAWTPDAPALLGDFRTMYTGDPLVLDKWLTLNAMAPDPAALERITAILGDPGFPHNNPNRLRALVGAFAMNNPTQFARPDGEGFRFVGRFVADVDARNPQVAARVLTAFRVFRSYEPVRLAAAEQALQKLRASGSLSRNTAEILERMLDG